jgi:hypothetical protein
MEHIIHLLLDKDIQAAKAVLILLILLNIPEQAVVAVQADKAAQAYTMTQIEGLKALVVKAATMNGIVLMLQIQVGLPDQQHGVTAAMA